MKIFNNRSVQVTAIGAVAYALMAFVIHLRWFPIGDLGVESDFYAELVVSAQRLVEGQFHVENYPFKGPLYSFLLVALHFLCEPLGADWYRTAVLFNALCGAGVILVLFIMLRSLFGLGMATAATLGTALCTEFFLHSQKASSDLLYMLLFLGTVSLVVGRFSKRRVLLAGVLAGLAFLTRYSGSVLLVGGLAAYLLAPANQKHLSQLTLAGIFLAGFLLVASPWFAINYFSTGHFLNDGNLMNVVLEFYSRERTSTIPEGGFTSLSHLIAHDPEYFFKHLISNIPRHLNQDMVQIMGGKLWVLVAAGATTVGVSFFPWFNSREFFRRWRPNYLQGVFFFFGIISFLAMCVVFYLPRFSLPLLPAYFVLGYGAIFGFSQSKEPSAKENRVTWIVAILTVLLVSSVQIPNILRGERYYYAGRPLFVLEQAPKVRALALENDARTLLARKPHLAYYAGLEPLAYPQKITDFKEFINFAEKRGAHLIAVGDQERAIRGETLILDFLHRARGITRLAEFDGLILYHMDSDPGSQATRADFTEIRERIKKAESAGQIHEIFLGRFDLGMGLMSLAQWEPAGRELITCLDMIHQDPTISKVGDRDYLKVNLAFCYLNLHQFQDGISILGEHLSRLKATDDAYQNGLRHFVLGRLYAEIQRHDEARVNFQQAYSAYGEAGNEKAMSDVLMHLEHLPE